MCEDAVMKGKKKSKKKTFSASQVVREMARERVGSPKPGRVIKPRKPALDKHKPTLGHLLDEE